MAMGRGAESHIYLIFVVFLFLARSESDQLGVAACVLRPLLAIKSNCIVDD